ncbi:MAG: glycosyltransferase family 2 protein [Thermodesulfobacteriota bacterium]
MSKQVSVIICTYNRKEVLKKCLDALFLQDFPSLSYEVIVVIDGSTDGTETMIREIRSPCRFKWMNQENRGPAAARNRGAKEAEGEVLLFLDDDIIGVPELITEHVKSHQAENPLVLGNIPLYPPEHRDYMTEGTHSWAQEHFEKLARKDYEITFLDVYFANASIKQETFSVLGGFDEQFRRYGMEDREFAHRLLKTGIKPVYNPKAVGYQIYLKDFPTYCDNYYWVGRGEVKLVKKYPELWPSTRLSRYQNARFIQRAGRRASLKYPGMMTRTMAMLKKMMEGGRRLHLIGAFLMKLQSFVRDYYYWLGVKEEAGGAEEFFSFLERRS